MRVAKFHFGVDRIPLPVQNEKLHRKSKYKYYVLTSKPQKTILVYIDLSIGRKCGQLFLRAETNLTKIKHPELEEFEINDTVV